MRTRTFLTAAMLAAGLAAPAPAAADDPIYEIFTHTANPRTGDEVSFHLYIGVDTRWEMDIDGDGFDDGSDRSPISAAPVGRAVARFATDGVHHVRFRLTPADGGPQAVETVVVPTHTGNWAPKLRLYPDAHRVVREGRRVYLDADVSDDGRGRVEVKWDTDGDGEFDDFDGPTPSMREEDRPLLPRGRHVIRARATDAEGASTVKELIVDVTPDNLPPGIELDAPRVLRTGFTSELRHSSWDPDALDADPALSEQWDTDGDGVFGDPTGFGSGFDPYKLRYDTPGEKGLGVRVTDAHGATATATRKVRVVAQNVAPEGELVSPDEVTAFERFWASPDVDDDVPTVPWELATVWDLDGDGEFDDWNGANGVHAYTTPGTRTIRAKVTDADGTSVVLSKSLRVVEPTVVPGPGGSVTPPDPTPEKPAVTPTSPPAQGEPGVGAKPGAVAPKLPSGKTLKRIGPVTVVAPARKATPGREAPGVDVRRRTASAGVIGASRAGQVTATLRAVVGTGRRARNVALGTARVSLAAGQVKPLTVGLSRAAVKRLGTARVLRIEALVAFRPAGGGPVERGSLSAAAKLLRPRR